LLLRTNLARAGNAALGAGPGGAAGRFNRLDEIAIALWAVGLEGQSGV
jgi:hypothetical protein